MEMKVPETSGVLAFLEEAGELAAMLLLASEDFNGRGAGAAECFDDGFVLHTPQLIAGSASEANHGQIIRIAKGHAAVGQRMSRAGFRHAIPGRRSPENFAGLRTKRG